MPPKKKVQKFKPWSDLDYVYLFKDIMSDPVFLGSHGITAINLFGTQSMTGTSKKANPKAKLVGSTSAITALSPTKDYQAHIKAGEESHFIGLKHRSPDDEGKYTKGWNLFDPSRGPDYSSSTSDSSRGLYWQAAGTGDWESNPANVCLFPGGLKPDPAITTVCQPTGFLPAAGGGIVKETKDTLNDTCCQTWSTSYLLFGTKYANWGTQKSEWLTQKRAMITELINSDKFETAFCSEAYTYASNTFYTSRGLNPDDISINDCIAAVLRYINVDAQLQTL